MSTKKSKIEPRHVTGITLDAPVHLYLDELAIRMRASRSWVLNAIVYEYAKLMENKQLTHLTGASLAPGLNRPEPKEIIIR